MPGNSNAEQDTVLVHPALKGAQSEDEVPISNRVEIIMNMQAVPMLPARHLPRTIEFYEKLGFAVDERRDEWGWASLRYGDCRLMLDESIMAAADGPRNSIVYLYPENIAEYHASVRARGLEISELKTTFYGMIEFRLTDPDGNNLWIGSRGPQNE